MYIATRQTNGRSVECKGCLRLVADNGRSPSVLQIYPVSPSGVGCLPRCKLRVWQLAKMNERD